jgi:uncharacterized protein (DUF1810 family)
MSATDPFELDRFIDAQSGSTHERAVAELRSGRKQSHWMWFVFPQLRGLGRSAAAMHYGITGIDEARAYLGHPLLGARLQQCAAVLEGLAGHSALDVFGPTDAMKLRSSLTLFAHVAGPGSIFERLLGKYFDGERDDLTLAMLQLQART